MPSSASKEAATQLKALLAVWEDASPGGGDTMISDKWYTWRLFMMRGMRHLAIAERIRMDDVVALATQAVTTSSLGARQQLDPTLHFLKNEYIF